MTCLRASQRSFPNLHDSEVRFLVVDMPEANDLTVGIMALVAQAEREAILNRPGFT